MPSIPSADRAFERLYRSYVRDVYRFALALLRNPAEAEDVTQTTFLNAYRALKTGEQPRRPLSWLLTIAHNAVRSRVRLAMRRPREVPLDDVAGELAVPAGEPTNVRELLRALGRLPFNQRAAITMCELEGRTYPEIAQTLGVSVPAVEALLVRARRTLRSQAAAIRGLALAGLPGPLRRLLGDGEVAAGGTLGAGLAVKVAAVVGVVVAAGGAGSPTVGAHRAAPRLEPRQYVMAPEASRSRRVSPRPDAASTAAGTGRARRPARAAPASAPAVSRSPTTPAAAPPAAPAAAPPAASPAASPQQAGVVAAAAEQAGLVAARAPVPLPKPPVPELPAPVPPLPVEPPPAAAVPAIPPPPLLPPVPTVPAPPGLP